MNSKLSKSSPKDPFIEIHPPKPQPIEKYKPAILRVSSGLICLAAPRFNDFMADIVVPGEVSPYGSLQIIAMQEVVSDDEGNDCTWLALKLFIEWLVTGDDDVVTEIDGESLSLDVLLRFGLAVRCEDYQKCIVAVKDKARAAWEAQDRLKLVKNSSGSLRELQTAVGEFEIVRTEDEEADHELQQSVNVATPESESDSEWTTKLP